MKKITPFIKTILFCLRLSWKSSHFYTIIRLLFRTASPLLPILSSFALKHLIDLVSNVDSETTLIHILPYVIVICLCSALAAGLETISQYCETMHGEILSRYLRLEMIQISLTADIEIYDNKQFYDKFTALKQDVQSIVYILWNTIDCISAVIVLTGAIWAFASQNILYCLVLIAASIPSGIITNRYTKSVYRIGLDQIEEERKRNYIDAISGSKEFAQEIRLFQIGKYLKQKYMAIWDSVFFKRKKVLRRKSVWTVVFGLLPEFIMLFVLLSITNQVLEKTASIGDISLYTSLFAQISAAVLLLVMRASAIYENKLKIDNIETFKKLDIHKIQSGQTRLQHVETIEFKNVWFQYPFAEKYALIDLSFIIKKGQKVGIVGVNGAGKSTMIKLLTRLYDVTKGCIYINGVDIREYELNSLRAAFSCYFQNSHNYAFTLRENIQFSDIEHDADDARMYNALKDSGIDDLSTLFPYHLDTYVGRMFDETGVELSDGQHQKIALARTFYRNSDVVILDEPSSSLDPEAEYYLFERMKKRLANKTVLYTSHRLSNINLADYILVIENGHLVEYGTKSQLIANKKRFAQLYGYQVQKYAEATNE